MTQTGNTSGLSSRPHRKGTGRALVTTANTTLTLGAPGRHTGWTYGSSYPKDAYGFDSLDAVFGPAKPLQTPTTHHSTKKQRTHPPSSQQQDDEDQDNMFSQLIRQFDALPDEPEEEKDEDREDEDEDDEEGEEDERMTNSPFYAATTPGRQSTASTATSPSVSRLSRTSLSPASPHTATRQLDLNEQPEHQETDDSKSDRKSASKTRQIGRRSSTRQSAAAEAVAEEDEEPKSARSAKRRSSGRVSFHIPDEQKESEEKYADEDEHAHAETQDNDDDDNDDHGGDADVHNDATHDDYDDTTQTPTSPSTASPIQPPPRTRRPRGRGGKRRETTRLIEEAKRLGIVNEEEASLVSGRPKRNRTAPLEWWKGDKYEYAMDEDGIGNLMPIVKSVVRSVPTPEVKKRKKGGRKAVAGKAHKRKQTKRESSESDVESDNEPSAFHANDNNDDDTAERLALVHSPHHQQDIHKVVAKAEKALPLEFLAQPMSAASIPPTQLPKGGKAFEEREFSSGILLLPPRAVKQRELTHTVESFYVVSAERSKLQVTIGETVLRLSKGDPFIVPVGNVYSLENLSERKEVKVYFHLIQSSEQVEKEVRQRMEEEHSGEERRRRMRDERDDIDDDEDDEEELN